jgi:predicted transcriptional regulator
MSLRESWDEGHFKMVNNFIVAKNLTSNEKIIFLLIHSWHWCKDMTFSERWIAKELGLSKNTVSKSLKNLETFGYIYLVEKGNKNEGNSYQSVYALKVTLEKKSPHQIEKEKAGAQKAKRDKRIKEEQEKTKKVDQKLTQGGSKIDPGVDQKLTQGGSKNDPRLNKIIKKEIKKGDALQEFEGNSCAPPQKEKASQAEIEDAFSKFLNINSDSKKNSAEAFG